MPTDRMPAEFLDDGDAPDDSDDEDSLTLTYEGLDSTEEDDDDEDDDEDEDDEESTLDAAPDVGNNPVSGALAPTADVTAAAPALEATGETAPAQPVTVMAHDLRKQFVSAGEVVQAVDGISFSFTTRQFVAITGPSGCGKTTLLNMLGSLEQPTSGRLVVDGVDVGRLGGVAVDQFRRKSIGFVFQSFYLIPNLTALENVMLPMEVAGVSRSQRRERAAYLLEQVKLEAKRFNFRPNKLSGGQQQRVAIARALANDPAVILADEPTGNLDSINSKRLVALLRELAKQGRTVIMVTHDRGIARLADVRLELVDGRIVRMTTDKSPAKTPQVGVNTPASPPSRAAAPQTRRRGRTVRDARARRT